MEVSPTNAVILYYPLISPFDGPFLTFFKGKMTGLTGMYFSQY